ncbi:MAG: hypothetical protein FD175_1365 [Beijerinckiaceae bacterium]|nr:MAG: hypothetical protein FD175_1365 [Beijerinckiaceae bacterium]
MIRIPRYPQVLASLPDGTKFHVVGREAETLMRLVEKGQRGLRAYDFPGGPPFRLGAYVFDLRCMGLAIRTEREAHSTGWHGVHLHDLRHTVATLASEAGVSNFIVRDLLRHKNVATTARYANYNANPVRNAADLVSARIAEGLARSQRKPDPEKQ